MIPDEEIALMKRGHLSQTTERLLAERELLVKEHECTHADELVLTTDRRRWAEAWQAVENFK